MFKKIQDLKEQGFKKSQVTRKLDIDYKTVLKYWDMSFNDYAMLRENQTRVRKLANYEEEILLWITEHRDLSAAQVFDWLKERYGDIDITERTVRNFVKDLRTKHKLPKMLNIRQYEAVDELPMGYQAQVDFGEIYLQRYDGSRFKVYVFAMVLSHSRYKFLWWLYKPFTASSFINAHEKAFEYFGGMPKEIVYDQDRVLAIKENYGDIIYTEDFENYRKYRKFKSRLCRAYDPESKGKIESVVKFAKNNFDKNRTFEDIDKLNEDSLKWLERTGNKKIHDTIKKVPAEVFALEKQHLTPIPIPFSDKIATNIVSYPVRKDNTVLYRQNRYQVPKGTYGPGKIVELKIHEAEIEILDFDTKNLIVKHKLSTKKGNLIKIDHPDRDKVSKLDQLYKKVLNDLGNIDKAKLFLEKIKEEKPRYIRDQYTLIINASKHYDLTLIEKSLDYCINKNLWSAVTLKDTFEYFSKEIVKEINEINQSFIPSKYRGIKPEVRNIQEYTRALEDDKKWIN